MRNLLLTATIISAAAMGFIAGGNTVTYQARHEADAPQQLVGFGCKGEDTPVLGVEGDDFSRCDAAIPLKDLHRA